MREEIWNISRSILFPYEIQPRICNNVVGDLRILRAHSIGQATCPVVTRHKILSLSPSPEKCYYNFVVKLTQGTEPSGHLWPKQQPWSDAGLWHVFSPAPTSSSLWVATQWGPAVSNFLPPTAGRRFSAVSCHLFQLCVLIIAFFLTVFFRGEKKIYQGFCFLTNLLPHSEQTLAVARERGNDRSEVIWVQVQQ